MEFTQPEPASWAPAADPPALRPGEVHLWRTQLDLPAEQLPALESVLSDSERARALRFLFDRDRRRFVAAHAALRSILGRCTATDARAIEFSYSALGKPDLAGALERIGIRFNLSHSAALALIAVTRERAVGVDVEYLGREVSHEAIAERFFSERERRDLTSFAPALRKRAFLDCWTRKEAFIKASGEGLFRGLTTFDVSLEPGEGPRQLIVRNDPEDAARWKLHALDPAPGFTGAVVVDGELTRLTRFQWRPD
jgi:4'-phosphopantetheinyl transferase